MKIDASSKRIKQKKKREMNEIVWNYHDRQGRSVAKNVETSTKKASEIDACLSLQSPLTHRYGRRRNTYIHNRR